jgi:hypothetical protein
MPKESALGGQHDGQETKKIAHREKARKNNVRESVAGYSHTLAVLYGQFVDSVYQMYEKYPGNPTPPALALPAGGCLA